MELSFYIKIKPPFQEPNTYEMHSVGMQATIEELLPDSVPEKTELRYKIRIAYYWLIRRVHEQAYLQGLFDHETFKSRVDQFKETYSKLLEVNNLDRFIQ